MKLVYLLPLYVQIDDDDGHRKYFYRVSGFQTKLVLWLSRAISSLNALRITEKQNSLTQKEELIKTATVKPITWYAPCIVGRRRIKQNAVRVEKLSRLSAHFRTTENDELLLIFCC